MKKMFIRIKYILSLLKKRDPLYYISGSYALPPPLTKEEEEYYLSMFNDASKKDEVRSVLIERNLRLVVYIARKFDSPNVSTEDLISIGTIGLIKAVNTFKVEKNIKLATYASKCIENEILMHLRKVNRIRGEVSLDEPLNVDYDGNELLLSDILGTGEDPVKEKIEKDVNLEILSVAVEKLDSYQKEIINYRFGLQGKRKKTQKELAAMLEISQSYISRLEKKIISNLRKEIKKMSR